MPHSKNDIAKFQKLYLRHYGKNLTMNEAEKRLISLVGLLRLVREVPNRKSKSEIKLKFNIKDKPI